LEGQQQQQEQEQEQEQQQQQQHAKRKKLSYRPQDVYGHAPTKAVSVCTIGTPKKVNMLL
jgi:hypothetical protein